MAYYGVTFRLKENDVPHFENSVVGGNLGMTRDALA